MIAENTNKAIVVNSLILYGQLAINAILSLLTTRFALKELGVVDYGLYAVLGGIISFITIINTISTGTANRFIAIAIGRGNLKDVNEQFNINLMIQVFIALVVISLAFPIGDWYIHKYVNYDGAISTAVKVYRYSIIGAVISFLGVPYTGLLMAKEKFSIFSLVDVLSHALKFVFVVYLLRFFDSKLIAYAAAISILTSLTTVIYFIYCRFHYPKIIKFTFSTSWSKYKEVALFSAWNSYGVIAFIGKNQGTSILVNAFFNTIYNTALGLANVINGFVNLFAQNIAKPISPQITKSYASGNMDRCEFLLTIATKWSFFIILLIAIPFFVAPDYVLAIWLDTVPPYTVMFLQLLLVEALIESLNNGIGELIFASGKIAFYQVAVNTTRLLGVLLAYIILKFGYPAYMMLYAYICVAIIVVVIKQVALKLSVQFDNRILLRKAYVPSVLVLLFYIPIVILFRNILIHPLVEILCSFVLVLIILFLIGFDKVERTYIIRFVKSKVLKI